MFDDNKALPPLPLFCRRIRRNSYRYPEDKPLPPLPSATNYLSSRRLQSRYTPADKKMRFSIYMRLTTIEEG